MNYISQNNSSVCFRFHLADAPRLQKIELQINTILSFSIIDVENSPSIEKELEKGEEFVCGEVFNLRFNVRTIASLTKSLIWTSDVEIHQTLDYATIKITLKGHFVDLNVHFWNGKLVTLQCFFFVASSRMENSATKWNLRMSCNVH